MVDPFTCKPKKIDGLVEMRNFHSHWDYNSQNGTRFHTENYSNKRLKINGIEE